MRATRDDGAVLLSCGSCAHWLSRHQNSALAVDQIAKREDAALAAGSPQPQGHCWLMPTPVPRNRSDVCGQHTEIEADRRRLLALAIAAEVNTVLLERDAVKRGDA